MVLSTAYWFAGGRMPPAPGNELEHVQRENDWTISEVSLFPLRLIAFCSVNPLAGYALDEPERCARSAAVRGMKLHLANSKVDLTNEGHVTKLAYNQRPAVLQTFARRIREVGLSRVLFGTDIAPSLQQAWITFAESVPLTADELAAIASNVAPYLRANEREPLSRRTTQD